MLRKATLGKKPLTGWLGSHFIARLLFCLWVLPLVGWSSSPSPAYAQDAIGISGTFHQQVFELPQQSTIGGSSIYLVVFNQGDTDLTVDMAYDAPLGVSVGFSKQGFLLEPGESAKVYVSLETTQDAVPGEYEVHVVAQAYREVAGGGVQLVYSAGQTARLIINGSSSQLHVTTIGAEGDHVVSSLRLFKVIDNEEYEVGSSETGVLDIKVSPGSFTALAYIAGEEVARESFEVLAGEEKEIGIEVDAVYFQAFYVVPLYGEDEEISLGEISVSLKNLYKELPACTLLLQVEYGDVPLEEVVVASLSLLQEGETELTFNYAPEEGWREGVYKLKLQLLSEGRVYASTPEEELPVTLSPSSPPLVLMLVGGMVAIVAACGVGYYLVKRRGRK